MKKIIASCALLCGASLLADTTMCFKENHPSMATIETVPLNGGACGGKYSINDMKNEGWSVEDIKIENTKIGKNYIYILKKEEAPVANFDEIVLASFIAITLPAPSITN